LDSLLRRTETGKTMASLKSNVIIDKDVMFRDLDGEAVILNLKTGKYYGLDELGTRMWSLFAEHGRVESAYRALLDEYDVPPEQLRHDLLAFIDELASYELLQCNETQA
jgi:hypothetical protein